jgi:energy-coupling factor transport system permease protein
MRKEKAIQTQGVIRLDPRTKLLLLLITCMCLAVSSSSPYEILLTLTALAVGVLNGLYKTSFKLAVIYMGFLLLQAGAQRFLPQGLNILLVSFVLFIRKILPCGILGTIMVKTTTPGEFMAGMNKLHFPPKLTIPITVFLRYFPMIGEEWRKVKESMKMREVSPGIKGLIKHPVFTMECLYVPMLMSASRIADELSIAALVRGIENPIRRTCLKKIKMDISDIVVLMIFLLLFVAAF